MADWTWSLDSGGGGRELTQAADRKVTVRRRAPADASFNLPGRHDEATAVDELVSDLTSRRDGEAIFRGRVGSSSDDIGADEYGLGVAAFDYGELLKRRLIHDSDSLGPFSGVDAGTLAMDIVDMVQARTNGNLGITAGVGIPAGVAAPDTTLSPGKSAAAHLDLLSNAGVFDWEIDAQLRLNIYPGGRSTVTNEVLDYGGAVTSVRRTVDPSTFGNVGRGTGDDTLTPELVEVADIATRPEGRWEFQYGDRDIHDQDVLEATTTTEVARRDLILPGYAVTLTPGFWQGPDHIWPGHVVTLLVNVGRLNVETSIIVEELRASPGDNGGETIEVALGWGFPADQYRTRATRVESRVRDLERI